MDERNVHAACELAIGPCSCVLRGEMRGIHLLLNAAWDERIGPSYTDGAAQPALVGLSPPVVGDGVTVVMPLTPAAGSVPDAPRSRWGPMHAVALILLLGVAGVGAWTVVAMRGRAASGR